MCSVTIGKMEAVDTADKILNKYMKEAGVSFLQDDAQKILF